MTAPRDVLAALEGRRARLAAVADELARELELWPSAERRRRLQEVVADIDRLDRQIAASTGAQWPTR